MPYLFSANSWARFRYLLKKVTRVDGEHETRGSPRSSFLYPIITFQCSTLSPSTHLFPSFASKLLTRRTGRPHNRAVHLRISMARRMSCDDTWDKKMCQASKKVNRENTGQILSTSTETYLFRGMRRWAQASLNARSICALSISSLVVFNSAWIQRQGRWNCR